MDKKRINMFVSGLNLITFCLGFAHGKKENCNNF